MQLIYATPFLTFWESADQISMQKIITEKNKCAVDFQKRKILQTKAF